MSAGQSTATATLLLDPERQIEKVTWWRLGIFCGALLIGLLTVLVLWRSQPLVTQTHDLYMFGELGRNIAEGKGMRYDGGPLTTRRAPLYPFLIAVLDWTVGDRPMAIQVVQAFLAAGCALLGFEIGRRLYSMRVGLLAAIAIAVHPMVMRYVPDVQAETLLSFLYALMVYQSIRLLDRATVLDGILFGLAAAAASMVKPVALPYAAAFAAVFLVVQFLDGDRLAASVRAIAAMLLTMAVTILPWTYRNYRATGSPILISANASGEFLRGYVYSQLRYALLREPPYEVAEVEANRMQEELFRRRGLVWEQNQAETERVQNVAALEKLRSSPAEFARKFTVGIFTFWYLVNTRLNSLIVGALALVAWCLSLAGVRWRRPGDQLWLVFLPVLSLNLFCAAFLALGRYSAPCIPLLMVTAAYGLDVCWERMGFGHPQGLPAPRATHV